MKQQGVAVGRIPNYGGSRRRSTAALVILGLIAAAPLLVSSQRREQLLALNSLYLAAATCLFALPVGALLAVLLVRTDAPGRKPVLYVLAAMLFMPLYLQTAAWDAGFGKQGWVWSLWGAPDVPVDGWRPVIWIHSITAIPWVALIVTAGLRRVDPDIEEAAILDASPARVFWRVTLPHAFDSLGVAALWVILSTVGEFTVADMYQVNTYARELYIGFSLGNFLIGSQGIENSSGAPFGLWPGVTLTAWLALAAAMLFARLTDWERPSASKAPRPFVLGGWAKFCAVLVFVIAVLLVAGVPLFNFAYHAGIQVEEGGGERLRVWSLEKLALVLSEAPRRNAQEIQWTLIIGVATATLAVLLAAPLAWLGRRGGLRAVPALAIATAGIAIPGPMIALALIFLLNRSEPPWLAYVYDKTIFAPTAALLCRAAPWAILVCWFAFRSVPRETLESAELDGAGPVARFLWIALPQRWMALALAWLIALVIATGDLAASILVVPPGIETLSVRIFGLIHSGVDDQVSAICLVIALGVVLAGVLLGRLARYGALPFIDASHER